VSITKLPARPPHQQLPTAGPDEQPQERADTTVAGLIVLGTVLIAVGAALVFLPAGLIAGGLGLWLLAALTAAGIEG